MLDVLKAHLDCGVTATDLQKAKRLPGAVDKLAAQHGLSAALMRQLSGLTAFTVRSILDEAVALISTGGLAWEWRRDALETVSIFLDSRWRPIALEVARPFVDSMKARRVRRTRVNAHDPRSCLALLAMVADTEAPHADRAWALRRIETCSSPAVYAIHAFRDIPDTVLRGAVSLKADGRANAMVEQSAVRCDPTWVATLVPFCGVRALCNVPASVLRRLPAPQCVELATYYAKQYLLSTPRVAAAWVNDEEFETTIPNALRTLDVVLGPILFR